MGFFSSLTKAVVRTALLRRGMTVGEPFCPVHGLGCTGMSDAGVLCSTWLKAVDPIPRPIDVSPPPPRHKPAEWVPLPPDIIVTNGKRCDMAVGPCSCGAVHTLDEQRLSAPFIDAHLSPNIRKQTLKAAYDDLFARLIEMTPGASRDAALAGLRDSVGHALAIIDMDARTCDDGSEQQA